MGERITVLAIVIAWLLGALARGGEPVAVVIKFEGDVQVTPENSDKSERAKKGRVLNSGDKLETGPGALCAIKFLDDKSLLRIKEKSRCVIQGEKRNNTINKNIFIEIGSFFARLLKPQGDFKITTPTSVASVKGTKFWILQFGQSGETRYICTEGVIEIRNTPGKVLLREGQTAIVTSRSRMPVVRLTQPGEIPTDENAQGQMRTLEIEFTDSKHTKRTLRIQLQD